LSQWSNLQPKRRQLEYVPTTLFSLLTRR
jgi:hypothetical protein